MRSSTIVKCRRGAMSRPVHTLPLIHQLLLLSYLLAEGGSLVLPSLLVLPRLLHIALLHLGPSGLPGSLGREFCSGGSARLRAGVAALARALIRPVATVCMTAALSTLKQPIDLQSLAQDLLLLQDTAAVSQERRYAHCKAHKRWHLYHRSS